MLQRKMIKVSTFSSTLIKHMRYYIVSNLKADKVVVRVGINNTPQSQLFDMLLDTWELQSFIQNYFQLLILYSDGATVLYFNATPVFYFDGANPDLNNKRFSYLRKKLIWDYILHGNMQYSLNDTYELYTSVSGT